MNICLIIPTGIDAEIGGDAGDGNVVAKLIGTICDKLITHPNVVNAADLNEMPLNTLYVEGSILDRFLEGTIELEEVNSNKILVVVNKPVKNITINAISASRIILGAEIDLLELEKPLIMKATMENNKAEGIVENHKELINQISNYDFDALALATPILVDKEIGLNYLCNGGTNPWGGVEALASKLIANNLNKPVAHAPVETEDDIWFSNFNEIVNPTIAPEMITMCFLHCILKGLHKAPRIGNGISNKDIGLMISPYGCWGRPHWACYKNNIPIIIIKNNKTVLNDPYPKDANIIFAENYLEAVGVIQSIKVGISKDYFFRPIKNTKIIKD